MLVTHQSQHSLHCSDHLCTRPVEQEDVRGKGSVPTKSPGSRHLLRVTQVTYASTFLTLRGMGQGAYGSCRASHCCVFSSRTSTSVSLKTTLSAPTPGCFTSSRIFVDSIPDAGKDGGRLMGTTVAESLVSQPLGITLICTVSV